MTKALVWAKLGLMVSAAVFLLALTFLALQAREALISVESQSGGVVTKLNTALDTINKPKSGTLSMLDDTILQGRLTLDATNKVLIHEQSQLTTLDADVAALSSRVDTAITAVTGTANAATGTLTAVTKTADAAKPVLDNAATLVANIDTEQKPLIGRANLFMDDADAFTKTLPPLSANLTTLTGNLDATTGDFQKKFHAFLFPAPCHQFKCHLGEVYNGVVDASKFIQPALYFKELLFGNQIEGTIKVAH